ncbi:MAG: DNA repair protein RecN [Elusimicrobia bacterium]|nr:DNA repair protein RecN [Elusimicrobiota bacterium]
MLNELSIKNYALIEDMRVEFSPGLNVLTGETGAGKTIIIEALGLLSGEKASVQQVRKGATRLSVAARLNLSSRRAKQFLKDADLLGSEAEDEVLLRREVDASGRSRCFVNDSPVSLTTLASLGELMFYSHAQHEHQLLLKPTEQRDLLDAFGPLAPLREKAGEAYARWRDLVSEQEALSLSEQERAQRIDLYRFQLKELQAAQLKPGEEEELERLLPQLKNAERLKASAQEAYGHLYADEGSSVDKARKTQRVVESLLNLGADLAPVSEMIREAVVRLEESAREMEAYANRLDVDPERLEESLTRLDLIARLKKKYGPTLQEAVDYQKRIEGELRHLENIEGRTLDLARTLAEAEKDLSARCSDLSRGRQSAAKKLAAAVEKEFRELGLAQARFAAVLEPSAYSAAGADAVRFLFSANPGEDEKPLSAVASGGELSRVMLALKTVLAKADDVPILIFDEVDAGVGGVLGAAVGKKLARLGRTYQVICITHLATIAACAQTHFSVNKEIKNDQTRTRIKKMSEPERVAEIARMFGSAGNRMEEGSISLKHAKELLAASRSA